jgi:hypothetical protein
VNAFHALIERNGFRTFSSQSGLEVDDESRLAAVTEAAVGREMEGIANTDESGLD